jgi:hypothetical protein
LLDKGFSTPAGSEQALDHLPAVRLGNATDPVTHAAPAPRPVSTPGAGQRRGSTTGDLLPIGVLVVGSAPALFILARRWRMRGLRQEGRAIRL